MTDLVNHPPHYNAHPSGVECITITEHFNFLLGSAIKYIWRADEKGKPIEDLEKAVWYVNREISRRRLAEIEADHPQLSDFPYSSHWEDWVADDEDEIPFQIGEYMPDINFAFRRHGDW